MRAAVLADDLTGALEMGAMLAARRLRTLVTMRLDPEHDCDALVIDTETRHLPPSEAHDRVCRAAGSLPEGVPFFKKADSTLRGPIAAEFEALRSVFRSRTILFTPAYPRMGRIVRDGCLYVNGVPVGASEFSRDPRSPVTQSHFGEDIRDAESDGDLEALIANAPSDVILAGSGGLGRVWVSRLPSGDQPLPKVLIPRKRPLLVCGSRHPVARSQAIRAANSGVRVLLPMRSDPNPESILAALANAAFKYEPDLLILFGGDTAAAVLKRFGIADLRPVCELMPGVVLSLPDREMLIVTKAGGFAGIPVVEQILGLLP
jgi:uncharacterized protein YgbK (DUF1537 family)